MRKYLIGLGLVLVVGLAGWGIGLLVLGGKVDQEIWEVAYVEGARSGYYRSNFKETERDGQRIITSSLEMRLTIKRYGAIIKQQMTTAQEETPEGKVLAMSLSYPVEKGGSFVLKGRVEAGQLLLQAAPGKIEPVPWDDRFLGPYRQEQLFKEKKPKPGDTFEYLSYEIAMLVPTRVKLKAKDFEEVSVPEVKNPTGDNPTEEWVRKKLLRVDAEMEKIKLESKEIPLPRLTFWLDENFEPLRKQSEIPGLGVVTSYRTVEAIARQAPPPPAQLPDLGLNSLVALDRPLDKIHEARSAVYTITVKGDDDPVSLFSLDSRQRLLSKKGNTLELEVKAVKGPVATERPGENKEEFLKSSFFLDSDNAVLKELSVRIVGDETDPWKKALRLEKWVHDNMKLDKGIGFIQASRIARDLRGDCRQHGMLTAALCRAAGLPSRTAIGLVYGGVDREKGPFLAFHMWTEVWIKGQWLALDAVMGQEGIGAGHLKITDHSWTDTQTLAPLLPVIRVIGKIKVDAVQINN